MLLKVMQHLGRGPHNEDVHRKMQAAIGEHGKLAHDQEMDFKMV